MARDDSHTRKLTIAILPGQSDGAMSLLGFSGKVATGSRKTAIIRKGAADNTCSEKEQDESDDDRDAPAAVGAATTVMAEPAPPSADDNTNPEARASATAASTESENVADTPR